MSDEEEPMKIVTKNRFRKKYWKKMTATVSSKTTVERAFKDRNKDVR